MITHALYGFYIHPLSDFSQGHANVSARRLYDWRKNTPEESSSFRAKY